MSKEILQPTDWLKKNNGEVYSEMFNAISMQQYAEYYHKQMTESESEEKYEDLKYKCGLKNRYRVVSICNKCNKII